MSESHIPLNVMIVDDSAVVARILNSTLTKLGHKVVSTAHSGADAITAYKVCCPDVVFMDITMPGMDGIEATEKIVKEYSGAHIIIVSSLTDKDVILRARNAGAKGYILNPIQLDKLRDVLGVLIKTELQALNQQ